ncbi:MAG: hypothetical protein ACLUZ6_02470 [Lachnospira eligens]
MDNMTICEKHREYQHIFYLEKMLKEAGYPYFLILTVIIRILSGVNMKMQIDIEQRAGFKKPMLEIFCDGGLLKLCDYRENQTPETAQGKFCDGLTSEDCMQIIEKIFKKHK